MRPTYFCPFLLSCTLIWRSPFASNGFLSSHVFLLNLEKLIRDTCIFRIACKSQWTRNLYFHVSVKWSKHFSLYIQVLSYWKFQNAQIKLTNTETFCVNSKVYFFEVLLAEGKGNFLLKWWNCLKVSFKYWIWRTEKQVWRKKCLIYFGLFKQTSWLQRKVLAWNERSWCE